MGKILVEVDAAKEYVVNILAISGVKLYNIRGDKPCRFNTKYGDFAVVKSVMEERGKCVKTIKDATLRSFIKNNAIRIGIYLGLIFAIIAAITYAQKVTDIEINGTKNLSEEQIKEVILSNISLPTDKRSLNVDEIEKAVTKSDGVSSASVFIKGKTLFCTVFEELPKVNIVDKSDYTPVVSKYDGIVTRVVVFDGAAAVKAGDTVRSGQTLILPKITVDEEKGLYADTKALGEVYGRVWVTETEVFYPNVIRRVRTGRSVTVTRFFKKSDDFSCPFTLYETEDSTAFLPGMIPLPTYSVTYYEVEEREEDFSFDDNADALIKDATYRLEESLPEDCKKVKTWFEIKRLDKTVRLVIYYEIEIKLN